MTELKETQVEFKQGLETLGFDIEDDSLFLINNNLGSFEPEVRFHIITAIQFNATAIYLRKQLNGSYKPQVYIFDFTHKNFTEENQIELAEIQKYIWSSGEAPLACLLYKTEIKILDCTTHIKNEFTPVHLVEQLKLTGKANDLYNKQFAIKIKSGIFWEEEENKNKFKFQNSSYDTLIKNIRVISRSLRNTINDISPELINKIIIQSILIKYLEERIDNDGEKLLSNKYFKKYSQSNSFNDVLRKGNFVDLLNDLNNPETGLNGNVFHWEKEEQLELKKIDLTDLADLLDTKKVKLKSDQLEIDFTSWRYFEFKLIPVELISRLYEEFLGENKKEKGLFYTPSHLAKLLVDECLPLKKYAEINLNNFTVLDPACGSGIFLVIVFKRLVQIWRLQNEMKFPELSTLKTILKSLFGVDKEEQAINLASFSLCLALCNELSPLKIIEELKFDDLKDENLIFSDFFDCQKIEGKKFDLVIGNPPFGVGSIKLYSPFWFYDSSKVKIPQGQIALKFLTDSLNFLKENGLQCLIIKSSGLIYNSSSNNFKELLFSKLNVIQILDFTALARNKALWDNGADVATAAIFIRKQIPNFQKNILHLTFRRTKNTKERLSFEIDDYDLHFVNRNAAIENPFIWKNNLLSGGRIKSVLENYTFDTFRDFLNNNNCVIGEGFKVGSKGHLKPKFLYDIQTLPTSAINENQIDTSKLEDIESNTSFEKIPNPEIFYAPNIIIWENIGDKRLPIYLNNKSFSFQHKLIGISNKNNPIILEEIIKSFNEYNNFYRFYLFVTSGQLLVNLNTVILKTDLMRMPFFNKGNHKKISNIENNVINDVINYWQDFIRHGENSKAVKKIKTTQEFLKIFPIYGLEFCKILNLIYKENDKRFRLSEIVLLENSFIATIFKYDSSTDDPKFYNDNTVLNLPELTNHEISKQLTVNRIIKLYPQKDTIIFIKPNQYRYWLSSIAYRDADKCFSDLSNAGY